jgi:hypothetical protein
LFLPEEGELENQPFRLIVLLFPYDVDMPSLDRCSEGKVAVLVFDKKIVSFREAMAAKHLDIKNFEVYSTICEKIVVDNCVIRSGEYC